MPQADSSKTQLYYLAETVWGVTPAAAMTELRATSESLEHAKETIQSQELRSDRQVPDIIEVGAEARGANNFELSYGSYDDVLESALSSLWVDKSLVASVTFTGPSTIAATGIETSLLVDQWIRITGSVGQDGFYQVATLGTDTLTVKQATITTEGPTASVLVAGGRLRNGTTQKSFTLERLFSDLSSGHYTSFTGMVVGTLRLDTRSRQVATGTFNWLGKEGVSASATVGTGGPTAATVTDILNGTTDIGSIQEGATLAELSTGLMELSLEINPNIAGKPALKNKGAIGIRDGTIVVSGNIRAYFEDGALYAKAIGHTATALHWRYHDGGPAAAAQLAGNSILITAPSIFLSGGPNAGGINQDVPLVMQWEARRHPTQNYQLEISRFPST